MRNIHQEVLQQIRTGSGAALATLVRASGSTPQKAGSSALFGENGLLAGTIGGGLIESEVQKIAQSVMISGASDLFYFNLDSDQDSDGAICGGEAEVLVDANPSALLSVLEKMEKALSQHADGYLLTGVGPLHENGRVIRHYWMDGPDREELPQELDPALKELIKNHVKYAQRLGFIEMDLASVPHRFEKAYLEHIKCLPRLVIAGGGHIGRALAHLGSLLEFEVTVVDSRPEFANTSRIPEADHLVVGEMGPSMEAISFGPDTYVVIVTHGHKHDGEALKACIGSNAAYIGMIGSANKVGTLKKQFLEKQWATREQWADIYAPVGLDIGSKSIQEIAISIAAQLVEVRNRKWRNDA